MSNCFEVISKFGNICSFKSDSVNKGDKVYTSPQTKQLSNEEIDKLADEYLSDYFNMQETIDFVRAIEERHGIK